MNIHHNIERAYKNQILRLDIIETRHAKIFFIQ